MNTMCTKVKSSLQKVIWLIVIKVEIGKIYKLNDGSEQYFKVERLKGVLLGVQN